MRPPFEIHRLRLYRRRLADLADRFESSDGVDVTTSVARPVRVDGCVREVDYAIEVSLGPDLVRSIAVMASTVVDGRRVPVTDVGDERAAARARRYAARLDDGAYFGVTDGERIALAGIEPTVRFEETYPLSAFPDAVGTIVAGERRIRDVTAFGEHLRGYYDDLEPHVRAACVDRIDRDPAFAARIGSTLAPFGLASPDAGAVPERTVEMLARQAASLLIDKLLFHHLLLETRSGGSVPFDAVPPAPDDPDDDWARRFWAALDAALSSGSPAVAAHPIFDAAESPLNDVSLADRPAACAVLADFLDYLRWTEALSDLFTGPLLGTLYEELIPPPTRSQWGQIYTPAAVARLITHWGVVDPDAAVLDPACGTGRFLMAAYDRLVDLRGDAGSPAASPILDRLHGIDINHFPAHLATMALVAMDPRAADGRTNVAVRDFFALSDPRDAADGDGFGQVDAVLMNPPYTRQSALPPAYKEHVREAALAGLGPGDDPLPMNRHAPLSIYFVAHATRFLAPGGRLGMLLQHSWLDARYGRDVRSFLLDNYRIVAVIGTRRERLVRTAEVNTSIVLLEREPDAAARARNEVRFVQLRRDPEWFERSYGYDRLLALIERESAFADDDLRIVSRTQASLVPDDNWGRFVRAPDVYLARIADALALDLGDLADVGFGLTTGNNDFFYLDRATVDRWDIEEVHLRPLVKSPRECRRYRVDESDLALRVLDVHGDEAALAGTGTRAYLDHGEAIGVPEGSFVRGSASRWYEKPMRTAPLLQPTSVHARHFTCANGADACVDKRLVCIDPAEGVDPDFLFGYLNSTLGILVKELFGRVSLGQGALEHAVSDVERLPVLDPGRLDAAGRDRLREAVAAMKGREIRDVPAELGADRPPDFSLDRVAADRRALDAVLMEDVLGLSRSEQLDVYRAVLGLVCDRIEKGGG